MADSGLCSSELLALHEDMVLLRTLDERCVGYSNQGRIISPYPISWGCEALHAGTARALGPGDWVFPTYRDAAVALLRGIPARTLIAQWRGHPQGWWDPAAHRVAGVCISVGSHVPHAAGLAWGLRLRGERACAVVFFGDGATSEGAFHEGLTIAAAMRAPLVAVCNNNGWSISTPVGSQSAAASIADKGVGYGIPSQRVDGGNVLAVHAAVAAGVERALAGEGPTLVEAETYRSVPHATSDDPDLYLDAERAEREREYECLGRFERVLRDAGLLDDERAEAARGRALEAVRQGMAEAEAMPSPDPACMAEFTYSSQPR